MPNCDCGKQVTHTTIKGETTIHQCCECFVYAGNSPADWHPECMKTYRFLKMHGQEANEETVAKALGFQNVSEFREWRKNRENG